MKKTIGDKKKFLSYSHRGLKIIEIKLKKNCKFYNFYYIVLIFYSYKIRIFFIKFLSYSHTDLKIIKKLN